MVKPEQLKRKYQDTSSSIPGVIKTEKRKNGGRKNLPKKRTTMREEKGENWKSFSRSF